MMSLRHRHPGCACVVFACVLLPVIFGVNPVTAGIGLVSGMGLLFLLEEGRGRRRLGWYPAVALASGVLNPLFNHNGRTVLFFLNRNPVTREAVLYGLVMGMLIAAALVWARCFSHVMDTEKLQAVTGRLSPKVSLILSMSLRYLPLFRRQAAQVREAQAGLGLIREENGLDRLRGGLRVMDGMVTWALENGITTADSMTARGYGSGSRTRYRVYVWERGDTALTALSLGLMLIVAAARVTGQIGYTWYPELRVPAAGFGSAAAYGAFGLLCLTPAALEIKDRWKWKVLRSRI
ncbi:MAG: energy-coupling factor transporter transmembrane protein EcfT [Clostridia bacterium]|nr:energy-coupling factor transporter transmembrane protein EcfT [Clostridia bacterium]